MKSAREIIIRPIVTEKSTALMEDNKYTFLVERAANKIQIKQAIEDIFEVQVESVNTINYKGKRRRLGRYPEGIKPRWKKAVITLRQGSKPIEIFEGR
ncbi:MAG TPA: 50S ribosomal protein L23 [Firmicutes bacterium]|nr:50S ribosomal protein L23 [Bacillota bacterium]